MAKSGESSAQNLAHDSGDQHPGIHKGAFATVWAFEPVRLPAAVQLQQYNLDEGRWARSQKLARPAKEMGLARLITGTQNRKAARQSSASRTNSLPYRRPRADQAAARRGRPALGYEESGEQSQAA